MSIWKHIVVILIVLVANGCSNEKEKVDEEKRPEYFGSYFCDAETIKENAFVGEGISFGNPETQSDDFAFSGKYSCKLDSTHLYGMTVEFGPLKKGTHIYAECYRLSKWGIGQIELQSTSGEALGASYYVEDTEGEWQKIVIDKELSYDVEGLKVFLSNNILSTVYFDDFKVAISPSREVPGFEKNLSIHIDETDFAKLQKYRDKAVKKGLIGKKQKKYVPAQISWEGKKYDVELRLKGDWTDHLEGDKWSFRIKMLNDQSLFGMKVFSIQSPHTRAFMDEWFLHKLMQKEGVLATRYQFIPVEVNGKTLGVYALEEHFRKELLESQQRREGPILKINEEGLWQSRMEDVDYRVSYYESAEILPFDDRKIDEDQQKYDLFMHAHAAMAQVKNFGSDLGSFVDYKQLGTYMALTDLGGSYHGMAWHNVRYYFNPITYKLEPVGFDCFAEKREFNKEHAVYGVKSNYNPVQRDVYFNKQFINDTLFRKHYVEFLQKITPEYLESYFEEISDELEQNQELLRKEYPWYSFDVNRLMKRTKRIRKDLDTLKRIDFNLHPNTYHEVIYEGTKGSQKFVKETGLKAYTHSRDENTKTITCYNYHVDEVDVIGYSFRKKKDSIISIPIHKMKAFRGKADEFQITVGLDVNRIHYVHNGDTSMFKILKWAKSELTEEELSRRSEYLVNLSKSNHDIAGVYVRGKDVVFQGHVNILEPTYIPENYRLVVKPKTTVHFGAGGTLMCYGDVLIGLKDNSSPILFAGRLPQGSGLSVLGAQNKVEIYNTTFENMRAYDFYDRPRTGMVSIYESDAIIKNCVFRNNNSEDALNLIRSQVDISDCQFENIYSDALDLDFCTGKVTNCQFNNIKNDALDISGSNIHFQNIVADGVGDKGISVGERSIATADNIKISNANIAVVAKDDSELSVGTFEGEQGRYVFQNNNLNVAVFMKKTEYGPAKVKINTMELDPKEYLVDRESEIVLDHTVIVGEKRVNVDSLYAPFKKKGL